MRPHTRQSCEKFRQNFLGGHEVNILQILGYFYDCRMPLVSGIGEGKPVKGVGENLFHFFANP